MALPVRSDRDVRRSHYTVHRVSHHDLEKTLRDLQRLGTKVADEPEREIWEFEHHGERHRLHFYPVRGGPATREFRGLTALQRAGVSAPRAIALLSGFKIGSAMGDAVVIDQADGLISLGEYLHRDGVEQRSLAKELDEIVKQLGQAKLGHDALDLDAFAVDQTGSLYLIDAQHVSRNGLRLLQILRLHHAVRRYASITDVMRAWRTFGFNAVMPKTNSYSQKQWRRAVRESMRGDNRRCGPISVGEWHGRFTKRFDVRAAWSPATGIEFDRAGWETAWPMLLAAIENDQLDILKRGDNGDVLRGEVIVNGRPIAVVAKRPKRKSIRQAIGDAFRPSRARRTWMRTWKMLVRDVACEVPLLIMEKRTLGYVTDAVVVFGAIDGPTLAGIELDEMNMDSRDMMFRRVGRTLRRIEELGFTHMDAKSTNWIVFQALSGKPLPVLVDLDGVRHYRWSGAGIARLLRAMKQHPQYTPADSLAICQGYAPKAAVGAATEASVGAATE